MANLSKRAQSVVESVTAWHVPPECQGQMIEYAYGMADDGIPVRRTTDHSAQSVNYEEADGDDVTTWDPWNGEPEGLAWQPLS